MSNYQECVLRMVGISPVATYSTIRDLLSSYGRIIDLVYLYDNDGRREVIVVYNTKKNASLAITALDGRVFFASRLIVHYSSYNYCRTIHLDDDLLKYHANNGCTTLLDNEIDEYQAVYYRSIAE